MFLKLISKKFWICVSSIAISLLTVSVFASCANVQEIKFSNDYPNKVAEAAQISKDYKDFAELLSETTLSQFYDISKVPRESGNMEGIRNYILDWAKLYNIEAKRDPSGCIYIDLKATPGHENDKKLIIQSHMDMVVTASDDYKEFNAATSSIEVEYNEKTGEVHAKDYKTNVGADNGQGLGLCMAIAKYGNDFEHGPIRILFTYDEETTMEGSLNLSNEVLDADYLINFDCPRCGCCVVGSAGNFPIAFSKQYANVSATDNDNENMTIAVRNLKGGHSGLDINSGRNSGSAFLIKYLNDLKENSIDFRLVTIDCGEAHNAIPDSFTLTININKQHESKAKEILENLANNLKEKFSDDTNFTYDISLNQIVGTFLSQQDSERIQNVLNALHNGVIKMNDAIDDTVETSNNIGVVKLKDGTLSCKSLFRSSDDKTLQNQSKEISEKLKALDIDWSISPDKIGSSWPISESNLSKMYLEAMKKVCNINATLFSPHASCELSVFHAKNPNLQMICIGGDVKDEHMLTETFYLKSFPVAVCPIIYIIEHINDVC